MMETERAPGKGYSSEKIAQRVAEARNNGWDVLDLLNCKVQDNDLRKLLGEPGVERLRALGLGRNQLSTLPPELDRLTALTELYLHENQLSTLPPEIGRLTALTKLYLWRNQLSTLPPEIGWLTALKELFLIENQLSTLPPEIGRLTALTSLNLYGNRLSTLPPEFGRLTALTALDLGGNQLSTLPPEIDGLSALTTLDLHRNRLSTLPPEFGRLTALTQLYLHGNRLSTLPPEIGRLTALEQLYLHGNDGLGIPPEILGPAWQEVGVEKKAAAPSAILDYYFRIRTEATRPLNEAKLVLIGDGDVGKTALVNLLVYKKKCTGREKQTQRIAIVPWQVERKKGQEIRLNVWDFGGQEIMHATHQFFLTERTLYLVVIDARRGTNESRLDYWLKLVESLAKDSPVIVVVNKIDEQRVKLDENTLRGKYGANVRDFAYVSCKSDEGVEGLREKIRHHVLGLGHVVDAKVPASWIAVKEKLETTKRPWLTYSEYQEMCRDEKITKVADQQQLIRFLHDLGVMLSFFHEDVEETRVLAPEWVTRGVYAIVTSKQLAGKGGVLRRSQLTKLLPAKDYPSAQRQFIVDMMRKFELCFPFGDGGGTDGEGDAWLLPGLLDEERPLAAELPLGALRFQYKYRVLPASIISRFIVRTFDQLDQATRIYWRNGIVLDIDGAKVRVIADAEERRIDIAITGDGITRRRGALTFVRTQFRAIHLPGMEPEERVPLPDQPEIAVPYKMLVDLERDPNTPKPYRWWHESGFAELDVRALLSGIETEEDRMGEVSLRESKPLGDVFLSYAHKDAKWRDELMTMLAPSLRGKTLEIWHDGKIKPSQDWRGEIEAALRRARVGVLLVSKHFLASDFINNEELPFLIAAAKKAKVKLSWMLIGDCMWDEEQFAKLQALHETAKPLSAFRGNARNAALKGIAQGIVNLAR